MMLDPTPDPAPTAKPIFKTDPVPQDWNSRNDQQKLAWLDEQGLPSDPTVNLGASYRCGAKITRLFSVAMSVLRRLVENVKTTKNRNLNQHLNLFLKAFNDGVGRLSNLIHSNCMSLLSHGAYVDGTIPLLPVAIPDAQLMGGDDFTLPFEDTFLGAFLGFLSVLIATWPWLQSVKSVADISYAQALKACVETGQTFSKEFQKSLR
ncbi:hypothetical protein F4808DRAFT_258001 [Astrocystis sublimbata]|nr:hypothetical protein F4808DRAFT_258001 [Astrocystis sublimbata]